MSLIRNFATVSTATMSSRVLGFVRDMAMAAAIGAGPVADAFVVAWRFPNLFRRLFAEGAFNSAFVPLFAKEIDGEDLSKAKAFAEEALGALAAVLLVITIVAEIAMPWLMLVLAPGFAGDPAKFELTVLLARIAFPYLLLISLTALAGGALNSLGRFAAAAFAPALLNVVLIAALVFIWWAGLIGTRQAGVILSWGTVVGGLAQLLMLVVAMWRAGLKLRFRLPRLTPGVRRLVALGLPGVVAGGVTQINIVIGTIIASLQAGAVAYLYYADRLYQLPLGVVGIAIATVLLPELSRRLKTGDPVAVSHTQNRSLEFAMLLTLPAAIALAVAPTAIIRVLFERGEFDPESTRQTAKALAAFAVGLPGFVLIKVFSPGYFAREDTKTPMTYATVGVVVNILASLALFFPFGHVGIAAATSIAGWANAALLGWTLWRRGHFVTDRRLLERLARIGVTSLAMGLALYGLERGLAPWLSGRASDPVQFTALGILVLGGLLAFAVAALVSGAIRRQEIAGLLRRRKPA
ncbi:MAG: murein biosynthesis integral membrane protein MurJ [Pseudomonadota bacterium]|nr:murein biosynthesis integral membrane protein MurJ [Pseudomonadota bacterium]